MDHGIYYVDRTGGDPVRIDDETTVLTPAQRHVMLAYLDSAERDTARETREWGSVNNLAQAVFVVGRDELKSGVYYAAELTHPLRNANEVTLLSGGLFPWYVQGDEKPRALGLLRYVRSIHGGDAA